MYFRLHQTMSSHEYTAFSRFVNEPIQVPSAWTEVKPFPTGVIEAAATVKEVLADVNGELVGGGMDNPSSKLLSKLQAGQPLTRIERDGLDAILESNARLAQSVKSLVNLPGYELDAFPAKFESLGIPDSLSVRLVAEQLVLRAHASALQLDYAAAMSWCVTAFRMAKRHPASSINCHLNALYIVETSSLCAAHLIRQCTTTPLLRNMLFEMTDLDAQINLNTFPNADLLSAIGTLRSAKRAGIEVDLSSNKPLVYFVAQQRRFIANDLLHQDHIDMYPLDRGGLNASIWAGFVKYLGIQNWLYLNTFEGCWITSEKAKQYRVREQEVEAKFNLTVLELLAKVRGEKTIEPEHLLDPFSGRRYLFDSEADTFYSVGPNGKDDGNQFHYDPSNGIVSAGDIVPLKR